MDFKKLFFIQPKGASKRITPIRNGLTKKKDIQYYLASFFYVGTILTYSLLILPVLLEFKSAAITLSLFFYPTWAIVFISQYFGSLVDPSEPELED